MDYLTYRHRFRKEILRICRDCQCRECGVLTYDALNSYPIPVECECDQIRVSMTESEMVDMWANTWCISSNTLSDTIQNCYTQSLSTNTSDVRPEYDVLFVQLKKYTFSHHTAVYAFMYPELVKSMFLQRSLTLTELYQIVATNKRQSGTTMQLVRMILSHINLIHTSRVTEQHIQELWTMEEVTYNNLIQWLPQEMIDDTLSLLHIHV